MSATNLTIVAAGYRVEVVTLGATLRQVSHGPRELLDGFALGRRPTGARGQVLAPWTNRIRDGHYAFGRQTHQLPLTDLATATALHGLVGAVEWDVASSDVDRVALVHDLSAREGYPWDLRLGVIYEVSAAGLQVTHEVDNLSAGQAPYVIGAHPYVKAGVGPVDEWTVQLEADEVLLVDAERMLPTGTASVDGTELDFRRPRRLGDLRLNHAYTRLRRADCRRAVVTISAPDAPAVTVWADESCQWFQLYTGDFDPDSPRRSIAVEPMSAPADAFNSGRDLVVLEPAGGDGSSHRMQWGIEVAPRD